MLLRSSMYKQEALFMKLMGSCKPWVLRKEKGNESLVTDWEINCLSPEPTGKSKCPSQQAYSGNPLED